MLLRFSKYPWVNTALPPTPPELGARTCRAEARAEAETEAETEAEAEAAADVAAAEDSAAPERPASAATAASPVPASPALPPAPTVPLTFASHRSSSPRMTAASARLRSDVSDNASKSLGASPSSDVRSDTW